MAPPVGDGGCQSPSSRCYKDLALNNYRVREQYKYIKRTVVYTKFNIKFEIQFQKDLKYKCER